MAGVTACRDGDQLGHGGRLRGLGGGQGGGEGLALPGLHLRHLTVGHDQAPDDLLVEDVHVQRAASRLAGPGEGLDPRGSGVLSCPLRLPIVAGGQLVPPSAHRLHLAADDDAVGDELDVVAVAVGVWIGGAYFFTSSTSFGSRSRRLS